VPCARRCRAEQPALRHYLDELHLLGGELSLDSRLVEVSQPLAELAGRSPDPSANREHEPYRRAITGIYVRLNATARDLDVELRERIFSRLRAEWQGVVSALLTIMRQNSLFESNPLLARSIRNRFPPSRSAQPYEDKNC
jgi:phosphoenolpyruvate carboxylase